MLIDYSPRGNGKTTRLVKAARTAAINNPHQHFVILVPEGLVKFFNDEFARDLRNLEIRPHGNLIGNNLAGKPSKVYIDNLDMLLNNIKGTSKVEIVYSTVTDLSEPELAKVKTDKDVSRVTTHIAHWMQSVSPTAGALLKRLNYHLKREHHPDWLLTELLSRESDYEYTAQQRAILIHKSMED